MTAKMLLVRIFLPLLLMLPWAAVGARGQSATDLAPAQAQSLVRRALANELLSAQYPAHPMRYLLRKSSPRLLSTKEIVESRDGDVARLLMIDDKPLGPEEEKDEDLRLSALLRDPGLQQHRKQSEQGDVGIVLKLLSILPRAFLYQYAGSISSSAGEVEKFTFRPNPDFSPPDLEAQALNAMTGEIWVDAAQERIARLEGHLQADTSYGWGVLGKLNKGGWIVLDQANVGGRQWRIVRLRMKMSLRILFKNKNFDTTEEMSQYAPVPVGLDYRQAIQMLRSRDAGAQHAHR